MTPPAPVTVLVRRTESVPGVGPSVDLGAGGAGIDTARLTLDVRALTGTAPSLAVSLETSPDTLEWRVAGAWPAKTTPGTELRVFQPVDRYVRARWELAGAGPEATFLITGEKLRSLLTLEFFRRAVNPNLWKNIPEVDVEQALAVASQTAAGYLGGSFTLPITVWGDDLRRHVAWLATWDLLSGRQGFNPEAGGDAAVRMNRDDAVRWLTGVAQNNIHPVGIQDSTPEVFEAGAFVVTSRSRGW